MSCDEKFIEATAYFFEYKNGRNLNAEEQTLLDKFSLASQNVVGVIDRLLSFDLSEASEEFRVRVYWALSKSFNQSLLSYYRTRLSYEVEEEANSSVYQLLICLDNLGETCFSPDRSSFGVLDVDLNYRDAKEYLSKRDSKQ